eukprot:UN25037
MNDNQRTNFTAVAQKLAVASQILTTRIDQTHQYGINVLNNIFGKNDDRPISALMHSDSRKKKRKKFNGKVLLKESEATSSIGNLTSENDPMHSRMAELFDAGDVKGLLLYNLATQKDGELIFDSRLKLKSFDKEIGVSEKSDKIDVEDEEEELLQDELIKFEPAFEPKTNSSQQLFQQQSQRQSQTSLCKVDLFVHGIKNYKQELKYLEGNDTSEKEEELVEDFLFEGQTSDFFRVDWERS